MYKCEVIENFNLKDFDKLKNVTRKSKDVYGKLFEGDTFECEESMADYLTGNNVLKKVVVKVVEVKNVKEAKIVEEKETIDEAVAKIEKTKKTKNTTKKKLTK